MKGYFDDRAPKIEDSNSGVENIIVNAMANRSLWGLLIFTLYIFEFNT